VIGAGVVIELDELVIGAVRSAEAELADDELRRCGGDEENGEEQRSEETGESASKRHHTSHTIATAVDRVENSPSGTLVTRCQNAK
jgi:hypothetical protein